MPGGKERRQKIEARAAVELGGENVGLQVLVEGLAQHFLVEANAVEPRPDRGRPAIDQRADFLCELKLGWQAGISQLRWAHTGYCQRPWRWDDMRAYTSVSEAGAGIGQYLGLYNSRRPHSSLDLKTPDQAYFNQPMLKEAAA